jgi:hypothetical protein
MSQIFKEKVNKTILYELLDQICILKNDTKYIFDNSCYKKANMLNLLEPFIEKIELYYHLSKKYYVERKLSYKMLATIIRQICRSNNIHYKQEIIYRKSTYEIVYTIFHKEILLDL